MTIGKRKGAAAKGAGGAPGNIANSKFGGSLSKNDHWYIEQAFGMMVDPGEAPIPMPGIEATGGSIGEYTDPIGNVWKSHTFINSGDFVVTAAHADPMLSNCYVT